MKKNVYISMAIAASVIFIGEFYITHGGRYLGVALVVLIVIGVFYVYKTSYKILIELYRKQKRER